MNTKKKRFIFYLFIYFNDLYNNSDNNVNNKNKFKKY